MGYLSAIAMLIGIGMVAWTLPARGGYASAEYQVIESDGNIEIRKHPDLMLAATDSKMGPEAATDAL